MHEPRWKCYPLATFITVERNLIVRLWSGELFSGVDPEPEIARLREHYRAIITQIPGVTDIEWQER